MAAGKYPTFREKLAAGEIDLSTDNLKFAAVDFDDFGFAITNASNATPVVITTPAPHGLSTDDEVLIDGVLGNVAANVAAKIVVLNTTTFELVGTTGSGAYTSGGRVLPLSGYEFEADITAAIIAESGTLTGKTAVKGFFTSDNPVFQVVSGDTFEGCALFKDTGNPATSPLISLHGGLSVVPDDEGLTLLISGHIFRI